MILQISNNMWLITKFLLKSIKIIQKRNNIIIEL